MRASSPPTPAELQVLRCAALGLTAEETAEELGIAIKTVRKHRQSILLRTGARNTAHAVHLAHVNDWWGAKPPKEKRR